MTSYAKLKWDIITEWNSDARYTNDKLISMASELGIDIDSEDRKAIIAKVADGVINAGVESGEYSVNSWGVDSDGDVSFKNYMGSLEIPKSTLDIDVVETVEVVEEVEELPDFTKMTKKALDEWAESQGIMLDRRKTKAHMLEELKGKLN